MSSSLDVLVVDDDLFIRELIVDVLAEAGYRVGDAASGPEALAVLPVTPPRLLLTDLRMPDMSGEQLIRLIRAQNQNIPIIAMSAHAWDRRHIDGATAFLPKPFDVDAMLMLVALQLGDEPS